MLVIPPAGISPAGFFIAQNAADPGAPPGILADAIDPATGEYLSIRRGIDPIDAQVLHALRVRRASGASVMDDGQDFATIETLDDQAPALIEAKARLVLRRLIANRDIAIVALTKSVDLAGASGSVFLQYRNLRRRAAVTTLRILPAAGQVAIVSP